MGKVVGYDISNEQIAKAKQENVETTKAQFIVSSPADFNFDGVFDKAVSIVVLPYARGIEELQTFFENTFRHLKGSGSFVSIIFNPDYRRFGQTAYNRRFSKDGSQIKVEFIDPKNVTTFSAHFSDFKKVDYERCAREAGFNNVEWKNLTIEEEGKRAMGEEFWIAYEEDCHYIALVVTKSEGVH